MRLVEEAGQIGDFLTAYREGAVCVVGGLVSQLVHNKVLLLSFMIRIKWIF